jgi:biotin transport system substrate-specific component
MLRSVLLACAGALLTALSAKLSVPLSFTEVPVTLQVTAVLVCGAALGPWRGALSQALYLCLGLLGVPVFATASSATLGYVLAFPVAAVISGMAARRTWPTRVAAFAAAALLIVVIGTVWLGVARGFDAATAIQKGALPFLPGAAIKVALALGLYSLIRKISGRTSSSGVQSQ